MNPDLTETQTLLRDTVRQYAETEIPFARIRELEGTGRSDEVLWRALVAQGWLGTPFPESLGGGDAGIVEAGLIVDELMRRAEPVLVSGRPVVLDATFGSSQLREKALALAGRHGVQPFFVEVCCAPEVAVARLERRRAQGASASDAGPELHDASRAGFEPPVEWPPDARAVIHTDAPAWAEQVSRLCRALSRRPAGGGGDADG